MNEEGIFAPYFLTHLPDGLEKWERLNVTNCAADLHDRNIDLLRNTMDRGFDFIGNVGNDLDGLSQIIAAPFFVDDGFVNTAGREVVFASQFSMRITLIMAEIEVRFGAVVCDVDFPMLVRAHRPRINVQVRIKFEQIDTKTAAFQQASDRCRCQPLSQR